MSSCLCRALLRFEHRDELVGHVAQEKLFKGGICLLLLVGSDHSLLPRLFKRTKLLVVAVLKVFFIVVEVFGLVKAILVVLVLSLVLRVVVHFYCIIEDQAATLFTR